MGSGYSVVRWSRLFGEFQVREETTLFEKADATRRVSPESGFWLPQVHMHVRMCTCTHECAPAHTLRCIHTNNVVYTHMYINTHWNIIWPLKLNYAIYDYMNELWGHQNKCQTFIYFKFLKKSQIRRMKDWTVFRTKESWIWGITHH